MHGLCRYYLKDILKLTKNENYYARSHDAVTLYICKMWSLYESVCKACLIKEMIVENK